MLTFNYKNRKTGARLAKMQVTFYVDRDSLHRAAFVEIAETELKGRDDDSFHYPSAYEAISERLTKSAIEKRLRWLVESSGCLDFETSDFPFQHDIEYGYADLVIDLADQAISRLYPELSTEVAA